MENWSLPLEWRYMARHQNSVKSVIMSNMSHKKFQSTTKWQIHKTETRSHYKDFQIPCTSSAKTPKCTCNEIIATRGVQELFLGEIYALPDSDSSAHKRRLLNRRALIEIWRVFSAEEMELPVELGDAVYWFHIRSTT